MKLKPLSAVNTLFCFFLADLLSDNLKNNHQTKLK
jgi:hypothetical protein